MNKQYLKYSNIGLIVFIILFGQSIANGWFSVVTENNNSSTTFISAQQIDNTSVTLITSSLSILGYDIQGDNSSITTQASLGILQYDIIKGVQQTTNPDKLINQYLSDIQTAISKQKTLTTTYQEYVAQYQAEQKQCESEKTSNDTAVIEAINTNELQGIETLIVTAAGSSSCESSNQTKSSAYQLLTKKSNAIAESLQKKYNLIVKHKSTISNHATIISNPSLISELDQLSQQLQ